MCRYRCTSAESLALEGARFDAVVASEVLEHVKRPDDFCNTLQELCAEDACVFVTTMSRTALAYALAIVMGEKVLGMVPDGAHDWTRFVTPVELEMMFMKAGMRMELLSGMTFDISKRTWSCSGEPNVNYAAMFVRPKASKDNSGSCKGVAGIKNMSN
jgi:2-polyprenyl-6-hydroxyphenyl methylase / 3-demethylubiquinone-9 3-methyltransferase